MTLTDLLGSALRGAALGLALYVTGCGGSGDSKRLCQSDYDCQEPSTCGSDGYCVVPGEREREGEDGLCANYAQICPTSEKKGGVNDIDDYFPDCVDLCERGKAETYSDQDYQQFCEYFDCAVRTNQCDFYTERNLQCCLVNEYDWKIDPGYDQVDDC